MRKSFLGLVAGAALLAAGAVGAAEESATGVIIEFDEAARTLVLDTGETFQLAEGVAIEGLTAGTEVRVSYEEVDGTLTAIEVEPAMQ